MSPPGQNDFFEFTVYRFNNHCQRTYGKLIHELFQTVPGLNMCMYVYHTCDKLVDIIRLVKVVNSSKTDTVMI